MVNKTRLSKLMTYILRHNPRKFGIELDRKGFVELDKLLMVITKRIPGVTLDTIIDVVDNSIKKRFQILDNKIRATYGHSINVTIDLPEVDPPEILYHGTPRKRVPTILKEGLKPMSRKYVHLSKTEKEACLVGLRRDAKPAVLKIKAREAKKKGIQFFGCGDVFLAKTVPREFIE